MRPINGYIQLVPTVRCFEADTQNSSSRHTAQTLSDQTPEMLLSGRRATEKGAFIFPILGSALQAQKSESASRSSASIRLMRE